MQKKIIALAIAAAFSAPAFADTTIYGVVDAAVAHASADGVKSDMVAVSGGLSTSRLGFKTAEDLSNGLKVVVNLEYALDVEAGSNGVTTTATGTGAIGNARQQLLGIAGNFGTVATGYLQTAGYDWGVKFDPTAGSVVSPLQNVNKANFLVGSTALAARAPHALAYISPDMGGVTVAVNYTTNFTNTLGNLNIANANADAKVSAYLLSATYNAGPLSVGGVYAKDSLPVSSVGEKADVALGASYDLGVAKLFATYQSDKTTGATADVTRKAMSLSAVAPVGPGAIAFSYAKNSGVSGANASGETIAWLQGLSNTTTLYAALSKMTQDTGTNAYSVFSDAMSNMTAGGSSTLIAVGLRKKF